MSKNILITGGAGYIGSYVNQLLHKAHFNTIVLDNLSRGSKAAITCGTFLSGDLRDQALLNQIFSSHAIDAVMHFAACTDVGESIKVPLKYYDNNVNGTLSLLMAMQKHHIHHFIFSSSAAVYGIPRSHQAPLLETDPCTPINPYGQTKLMIEKVLLDLQQANHLRFCALRYFNATGGDPHYQFKNYNSERPESNLIPRALKSLKKQEVIPINGTDYDTPDGTCIRDYIHLEDLGSAHVIALQQLLAGAPSDIYNLGNGHGYSIREVIASINKVTGKTVRVAEGPRRPGDPPILIADASKARKNLGWKPHYTDLDQMIEHTWKALC